jgi:hypothetical protein
VACFGGGIFDLEQGYPAWERGAKWAARGGGQGKVLTEGECLGSSPRVRMRSEPAKARRYLFRAP